jgi:hypothetical protein
MKLVILCHWRNGIRDRAKGIERSFGHRLRAFPGSAQAVPRFALPSGRETFSITRNCRSHKRSQHGSIRLRTAIAQSPAARKSDRRPFNTCAPQKEKSIILRCSIICKLLMRGYRKCRRVEGLLRDRAMVPELDPNGESNPPSLFRFFHH